MDLQPHSPVRSIAESKRQLRESIWLSADIDTKEILRQLSLSNPWPELITYDGSACSCNTQKHETSSSASGTSSCALISMFCARTILDLEKQVRAREYRSEGLSKEDEASGLLDDILSERTVQRIVSIGQHLKGALRMKPAELLDVPMFEQVFLSQNRLEQFASYEEILTVLDHLCNDGVKRIASTVITQGGQSVVCVRMSVLEEDLFVLFDPHRRHDHPNGPSFMLSTCRKTTAKHLDRILDDRSLEDSISDIATQTSAENHRHIAAQVLNTRDSYHRISSYQNEQMLRDSFLCIHEEALNASVDYVNFWNHLLTPDVGPSGANRAQSSHFAPSISLSSSASSTYDSANAHPLPPQPPTVPLASSRTTHVSESWRPDVLFGQSLLDSFSLKTCEFAMKGTFDCAVCIDTLPLSSSVQLSGCDHRFCKECLCGHVQSFLSNGRFPIECPVCLLDRSIPDPGNVNSFVLDRLQLPKECSDKFQELQILQHSVRLECPKCHNSDLVPRKEYLQAKVLACSSRGCLNKWCKYCSKPITDTKGKHSCKGDGFDKMMKKKGWRYCPGCTMPVQKDSGCNHMACTAPGCHSHFCYKCGKLILTSATGRGVGEEVTSHYATNSCRQFERKFKCSIQ
ncbi:hypothetical protein FA15DRAFT_667730 [Coprinopsis marcescibilis]|uniref:RING-type domain-containing protein n=1 Tax=Coprinopsis marcescibilis TaxID=230819 RepID=A0A5C3KZU5_COPMA|nr:hypothetical protein FA15DRAFT_667730 [Coprinopsis marcescibilis]